MNMSNLLKNNEKALKIVLCLLLLISNFTVVLSAEDTVADETETITEDTEIKVWKKSWRKKKIQTLMGGCYGRN